MPINNKILIITFLCLVLTMGYTMYNIYQFMPAVATCQDEFDMINKCGCVPCDKGLIDLFNLNKQCETQIIPSQNG